jgi:TRAP-type C4-dicarboxylate transport system permease small subunit
MVLSRQLGFISRSLVVENSMSIITLSDRLSKFLMVAAAAWAFGLAFLIMADIVGRTVFSKPIYGTAEMVAASVVIVVFLQAGYAIRSRSMLRADFLVILLPDKVQRVLLAIGYLLGAGFFLMIITGGWEESVRSFIQGEYEGEGALRVPSWPARWTVLLGSALAMVNYLVMAYLDVFKPEALNSEVDANASH